MAAVVILQNATVTYIIAHSNFQFITKNTPKIGLNVACVTKIAAYQFAMNSLQFITTQSLLTLVRQHRFYRRFLKWLYLNMCSWITSLSLPQNVLRSILYLGYFKAGWNGVYLAEPDLRWCDWSCGQWTKQGCWVNHKPCVMYMNWWSVFQYIYCISVRVFGSISSF